MSVHPYRIGKDDRIVMRGEEYRMASKNALGWIFERVDRPDQRLGLTVPEFEAEMLDQEFRLDPGALAKGQDAARMAASARDLSEIPPDELRGVLSRLQYVNHFFDLEGARDASRSDAAMDIAASRIHADLERERIESNERILGAHLASLAERKSRVDAPAPLGLENTPVGRPCGRTLLRWVLRYVAGGRSILALRQGFHRSGNRERRPEPEVRKLLVEAAQGYMSLQRPTRATCHLDLRVSVRQLNLQREAAGLSPFRCPSRRQLEEEIKSLDKFEVYAARHGADKAIRKFGPIGAGLDVTRAGERIEMDEWEVHALTLFQKAGIWDKLDAAWRALAETHRLYVCVALCAASRTYPGVSFSSAPNTAENAIACLAMVPSDKTPLAKWAGAQSPWQIACTPETVATDAGAGFVSDEFTAAVVELTANKSVPASGVPNLRARVERGFGTFETDFMPFVPGRTFPNIVERGDYDSQARAALLDVVMKKLLIQYIVDVYHQRPHSGLKGATPANKWAELKDAFGLVPCRGSEVRRTALGVELSRKLGRHGVRVLGLNYTSEILQERFRKLGAHEVAVRVDPLDLGRVSVRTPKGWLTCPCVQRNMSGVSIDVWVATEADLRATNKARAKLSEGEVLDAIHRMKAIVTDAEKQFGLGGARPSAKDIDRLQARVRISFPPVHGFDGKEPPLRDIKAAATPRGTPIEVYAVIDPDDEDGQDDAEPFNEFVDTHVSQDPLSDQKDGGRAHDTAETGGSSRRLTDSDTPPVIPPNDVDEDPFYQFEDGDDE